MTNSIGHALGLVTQRSATSAFAAANERGAGPHDFEREFERLIVQTWFVAGPMARPGQEPTVDPAGIGPMAVSGGHRSAPGEGPEQRTVENASRRDEVERKADQPPSCHSVDPIDAVRGLTAMPASRTSTSFGTPTSMQGRLLPVDGFSQSAGLASAGPHVASAGVDVPGPWPARTSVQHASGTRATAFAADEAPAPRTGPAMAASAPPPAAIRLHVEADGDGAARVWLGVDAAARGASGAVLAHVRDTFGRSGMRLSSVVINGASLDAPTPSPTPRQET